jgi:hypothetical protein
MTPGKILVLNGYFFENMRFNQKKIGQFSDPAAAPEKGEVI